MWKEVSKSYESGKSKKMKKVFKYGTGFDIPDGAEYLTTKIEINEGVRLVWHYFLVEVSK